MQIIIHIDLTVEQYVEQEFHRRVRAPGRCGNCGRRAELELLGYYDRYTTGSTGAPVDFSIARFRCETCGRTTSCLPSFAQPYRLVASTTIQAYGEGDKDSVDVRRNEGLLRRYFKSLERYLKVLRGIVGSRFGRAPPEENATAFWRRAVAACGSLAELTVRLVHEFQTTCFGAYGCHRPSLSH